MRSSFGRRQRRVVIAAPTVAALRYVVGSGGAFAGGTALALFNESPFNLYPYTGVGGGVAGGIAPHSRTRIGFVSGGANSGGAAVTVFEASGVGAFAYTGSGGASASGSAGATDAYAKVFWVALEVPGS